MIIQCPDCSSRYRIKDVSPGHPDIRLQCPGCRCSFSLVAPLSAGDSPTVVRRASILVVDDAHFFREMISDLLMPLKCNLKLVATASEAYAQIRSGVFHLLLLDLNLPDKHGFELISELRADPQIKEIRILAMSGVYRRENDAMAAIRAGADAFISKSFRPEDLRDKVRKLLEP